MGRPKIIESLSKDKLMIQTHLPVLMGSVMEAKIFSRYIIVGVTDLSLETSVWVCLYL